MTINIAAIEKRLKAITKWPWSIAYGGISESDEGFGIDSEIEPGIVAECWPPAADAERKKRCYADAHFIAHAPSDIAALVAEVRRLRERVQALGNELLSIPCTCHDAYVKRRMVDPSCPRCSNLDEQILKSLTTTTSE